MTANSKAIRHSVIAGQWYPGNPQQLQSMLQGFFHHVKLQPLGGELIGLITPHAGYVYSGLVAAYAYAQLQGQIFPRVVIVSPVHRIYAGRFATTDKSYYETPLGLVPVDTELLQALTSRVQLHRVGNDGEHSLEIQLPFLQQVLGEFKLTPIMMGEQDWKTDFELGQALSEAIREVRQRAQSQERVLLVASSDLSHFHPYAEAVRLDKLVLERIAAYDPEGLAHTLAEHKAEACGGGPISAVMAAARKLGANRAEVLQYMNSGDVTGDHGSVVGYGSAVLLRA